MSYLISLTVYVIKLLSEKNMDTLIQACQMKNYKKSNTLYWLLLKELTVIYVSKAAKSATP